MEQVTEDKEMKKIAGTVERIIFASNDGAFCVFRLKLDGQRGSASVTYRGPAPVSGHHLTLLGEWIEHPRFGEQFRADKVEIAVPSSAEGIERFLASGAVEGVGKSMAARIVAMFGDKTLEIIEKHPKRLQEVAGIGKKTAEKIYRSYMEKAELREIMLWLEEHNVTGAYAARIYKKYGSFSIQVMETDPFRLAREVDGIGFVIADSIANGIGFDKESDSRISAGLDYQLMSSSQDGHCCVPEPYLVQETSKLLKVRDRLVADVLQEDLSTGRLEQECVGADVYVYNRVLYEAERYVAECMLFLQKKADSFNVEDSAELVAQWEDEGGITLAEKQRQAIQGALDNGAFILTGGPGTGKTTVIRGMIDILEEMGMEILLGAPTGRAAKRLSEAAGRKASTIHRMLGANGATEKNEFEKNEDEPLEADVIIIDEVSMMDIILMRHFLAAVPVGCHVILVGDVDQLPSVGAGSVLKDLLRSGKIPQVKLTEVFRQQETSNIVLNAHAINAGRLPDCKSGNGFYFYETAEAQQVEDRIVKLCADILPRNGYKRIDDVQVLSPMHRGVCGVESLNQRLQEALNPHQEGTKEWGSGGRVFRIGDKVMQMKNNYEKQVFNGDIGMVTWIDDKKLTVLYGDEQSVDYDKADITELQLAYCMSVHKSQGSEYKAVIMPLVAGHYIMLQRNLLYTAVTRAREVVMLLGSKAALNTAVSNDRTRRRYSLLTERLASKL